MGSIRDPRRRARATQILGSMVLCCLLAACSSAPLRPEAAQGPLRVSAENPRYFSDDRGNIVYLAGFHTWRNLQDLVVPGGISAFDYPGYLDFLVGHHLNFFRLWRQEEAFSDPLPYQRTGPGLALDGKLRFDLDQPNPAFYTRLSRRVAEAERRGLYVAVMLFQGWSIERKDPKRHDDPWAMHPFHRANNVNGVDGDRDRDGEGKETHTTGDPALLARQVAFARRVVDAVNAYDNVLYEIANESTAESMQWQESLVRAIHEYEATKPKRHPVIVTAPWGNRIEDLWASKAEAVSPGLPIPGMDEYPYREDPPANDGRKVIINDTDHLWGVGGTRAWVWQSFMRGLNPIYMDPYSSEVWPTLYESVRETRDQVVQAMGQTRMVSGLIPLARMAPREDLCSSRYCLVDPGRSYALFVPAPTGGDRSSVTVELAQAAGMFDVRWLNLDADEWISETRRLPGGTVTFTAPFAGEAVLLLLSR
ncbi:MAG: hypothetical protein KF814_01545 [Nitrospiraceae bacterium]|nr:hypothetical protein [Nitrospiraceae bacterium]